MFICLVCKVHSYVYVLIDWILQKQKHDKELSNAQQRVLTLEKLCRALQAERNELQNQLNVVSGKWVSL